MSRYKVKVGKDFDVKSAKVETSSKAKDDEKVIEARHRNILSVMVLGLVGFFLLGSAVVGLYEGHFDKLQVVYNMASVPVFGTILGYYFHKRNPPK